MCGEHVMCGGTLAISGSIIPACAGNMFSRRRSCFSWCGSSPRVRGTYVAIFYSQCLYKIIPACAGNISFSRLGRLAIRDHPRVCGEHPSVIVAPLAHMGSSPRVRGTCSDAVEILFDPRIIPACAGNMLSKYRLLAPTWDHPRVCGEHVMTG